MAKTVSNTGNAMPSVHYPGSFDYFIWNVCVGLNDVVVFFGTVWEWQAALCLTPL